MKRLYISILLAGFFVYPLFSQNVSILDTLFMSAVFEHESNLKGMASIEAIQGAEVGSTEVLSYQQAQLSYGVLSDEEYWLNTVDDCGFISESKKPALMQTAIKENDTESFSLLPNPAWDILNIEAEQLGAFFYVASIYGQEVFSPNYIGTLGQLDLFSARCRSVFSSLMFE